jgi:hypothetical protein
MELYFLCVYSGIPSSQMSAVRHALHFALDAKGRDYSLLCTMCAQYKCLKNIPDIHQISMKVELSLLCRENI